jgi:oxygen-dependent protoporphyrinogen oxidase
VSRAVVIGAGAAGLAAAVGLVDGGFEVTVVEADTPGGKARTLQPSPGWSIEWGPHSLTSRTASVFALAERLGVEAVPAREEAKRRFIVRGGQLVEVPKGLSRQEWLDVACGLVRAVDDAPGATLRQWVTARFGPRIGGEVLDAGTSGVWACSPDEIEAASALPWLVDALQAARRPVWLMGGRRGGRKGTWTLRGGLGALTEAARAQLGEVFVTSRATGLRPGGPGWIVETDRGLLPAEAVVVATDAADAAPLLEDAAPTAARLAAQVRYAPLAVLHVRCSRSAFPPAFGFLAPPSAKLGVLGAISVSSMLPDRAPAGQTSFAVMFGGTRAPDDVNLDDEALLARFVSVHRALTREVPRVEERLVVRHPRAVAIPGPGHRARSEALLASLPPGLAVAGAWIGAGALEDAVRSGGEAAGRLRGL